MEAYWKQNNDRAGSALLAFLRELRALWRKPAFFLPVAFFALLGCGASLGRQYETLAIVYAGGGILRADSAICVSGGDSFCILKRGFLYVAPSARIRELRAAGA